MKIAKITIATILAIASTATFARGGGRGGRGMENEFFRYIARAEATDGSGIFFMAVGQNRADAYAKALEQCFRHGRTCTVDVSSVWSGM